jgi:hypothetical protein
VAGLHASMHGLDRRFFGRAPCVPCGMYLSWCRHLLCRHPLEALGLGVASRHAYSLWCSRQTSAPFVQSRTGFWLGERFWMLRVSVCEGSDSLCMTTACINRVLPCTRPSHQMVRKLKAGFCLMHSGDEPNASGTCDMCGVLTACLAVSINTLRRPGTACRPGCLCASKHMVLDCGPLRCPSETRFFPASPYMIAWLLRSTASAAGTWSVCSSELSLSCPSNLWWHLLWGWLSHGIAASPARTRAYTCMALRSSCIHAYGTTVVLATCCMD